MSMLEHPQITCCLATGYPQWQTAPPVGVCKCCKDEVYSWEAHGVCDGEYIHAECADEEWAALTAREKLEILGYQEVAP